MKKVLIIFIITVATLLIIAAGFVANALFGNPISMMIVENSAKGYLEENYNDTDYRISEIAHSFKDGYYHASITSESSIDTHFTVVFNGFGRLIRDNYDYVTSGWNTAMRLDNDYRSLARAIFDNNGFTYEVCFGEIVFTTEEYENDPYTLSYALVTNELIIDGAYDVNELGKRAGKLTVCVRDVDPTAENMAETLLAIRETFDREGLSFFAIDCILESSREDEEDFLVRDFLYSDITEEGLCERVTEAYEAFKKLQYEKENEIE